MEPSSQAERDSGTSPERFLARGAIIASASNDFGWGYRITGPGIQGVEGKGWGQGDRIAGCWLVLGRCVEAAVALGLAGVDFITTNTAIHLVAIGVIEPRPAHEPIASAVMEHLALVADAKVMWAPRKILRGDVMGLAAEGVLMGPYDPRPVKRASASRRMPCARCAENWMLFGEYVYRWRRLWMCGACARELQPQAFCATCGEWLDNGGDPEHPGCAAARLAGAIFRPVPHQEGAWVEMPPERGVEPPM